MRRKFDLARKMNLFQYMGIRNRKNVQGTKFYPYKNSCFQISKNSLVVTNGALHFNCGKIGKSKVESYLRMDNNASLIVNGFFSVFYGCDIAIYENAKLVLGSGFINAGGQIRCGNSITIGNNVAIGRNCYIQDSDFHVIIDSEGKELRTSAPVVIEDNVWIGANVTILKGVTIGTGAIVGAGTVVTKNVSPHTVVVGNPNHILREKIRWK